MFLKPFALTALFLAIPLTFTSAQDTKTPKTDKPAEAAPLSILGTWDAKAVTENGELKSVVTFRKEGKEIKGSSKSDRGEFQFKSVKVEGKNVTVDFLLKLNEDELNVRIKAARKDVSHLEGKWTVLAADGAEAATGEWNAVRQTPSIVGNWDLQLSLGEGAEARDYGLQITQDGDNLKGVLISPRSGEHPCKSVTFKDGELILKATRTFEDTDYNFTYSGKLSKEDALSGTITIEGADDLNGKFTGTRKVEAKAKKE